MTRLSERRPDEESERHASRGGHRRLLVPALLALTCVLACAVETPVLPAPASASPAHATATPPEPHPSTPSPPAAAETLPLRVASWNIERLGHGARKDLELTARVLGEFDLIAVQEVMTPEVVDALLAHMPGYEALLTDTPRPQASSYSEYYAYFYRSARLDPTFSSFVPDPHDRFAREPYAACFALLPASTHLCLLSIHVVYGRTVGPRKAEILALDDALRWAQQEDETSHWIVLGDFNRVIDDGDSDDEPEEEWRELLDRRQLRAPLRIVGPEQATTLSSTDYANAYDHIFVSESLADSVGSHGRYELVREHCAGDFERCERELSDHAPVFIELRLP